MFHGSMVALVTPMQADDSIDWPSLERLLEHHIENGTDAIVSVGTTGESATLDAAEHCAVIQRTVEIIAGRIPVIAGTGANATREAVELTRCALEAGANACLLVTPYYNKPTQEGLYHHYKHIAESVPIPQIIYNVPGRTAVDINNDTIARLVGIPNIIGVKDATGDIPRGQALIERHGEQLDIYSGDDLTALELLKVGGKGSISVTANVAPRQMHAMCTAALAGDHIEAEAINASLMALHRSLFMESNPIPVKWALHTLGHIPAGIRLPLTPLSSVHQAAVRDALSRAGLL